MRNLSKRQTPQQSLAIALSILCLGGASLTSCAASRTDSFQAPEALTAESGMADKATETQLANRSPVEPATPEAPRKNPQLIKTANLTVRVEDIESTLDQVNQILNQQQGDLLSLEDYKPQGIGDRHRSSIRMRVPQQALNATLERLEDLGTVQNRSIQAKDVSNQIIDNQARLKNLRKSEEMVLKIMDRSGSIPDVLSASKELSTIRENIERLDAQLQSLQSQVAFSTINLQIESLTTTSSTPKAGIGLQLNEAWKTSTNAMGSLTMAFIKLGIWGVAFSPYLIAFGLLIWLGQRSFKKEKSLKSIETPQESSS